MRTTIKPTWQDQDAFIVAGGTSVTQADVDLLKGRNVVVINSSYLSALWAPVLFFADERWWTREIYRTGNRLADFKGDIYTISGISKGSRLKRLGRQAPSKEGICSKPDTVTMQYTSVQAAMNLCVHKGAKRIILLGVDNKIDKATGRAHHHEEYPKAWPRRETSWAQKFNNLETTVQPLKDRGIQVINCSPISELPWWPKQSLAEVLANG